MNCTTGVEIYSETDTVNSKENNSQGDFSLCGVIVMELMNNSGGKFNARALLDTGSGTNFISKELLSNIKHEKLLPENLTVTGINTSKSNQHDLVKIFLTNNQCSIKNLKCYVLQDLIEYDLNKEKLKQMIQECRSLPEFQDPFEKEIDHREGIGIILGPGAIRDICYAPPIWHGKYTIDRTFFGPAVSGRIPRNETLHSLSATLVNSEIGISKNEKESPHPCITSITTNNESEEDIDKKLTLLQNLEFLSSKECLGVQKNEIHNNDRICMENFKKEVIYDEEKKNYTVALPWNENKWFLPSNANLAFSRMRQLQTKFIKQPEFGKTYQEHVKNLVKEEYIEEVTESTEIGDVLHYLPHNGIIKDDSATTTLRMVMDGSSKINASEFSLNNCLYTGPNLVSEITKCIIKMRCGKFAALSDIEKAFLKLLVRIKDRDALRFFFPKDIFDLTSPMLVYRYRVVLFGASCSPFLLAAVVQKHLEVMLKDDKDFAKNLIEGLYVDNLLTALDNEKKLIEFFYKTRALFKEAGLNLRQWGSNSELLTELAKKEEVEDKADCIKVLGLRWDPKKDELGFRRTLKSNEKYTKRSVLETTNSIFDPFGYLIPVEIRCRMFLSNLWKIKLDWDMLFQDMRELKVMWDQIKEDCREVLKISFRRELETSKNMELHVFADASIQAYGAVAYIVIPRHTNSLRGLPRGSDGDNDGCSQFLMSKAKITSAKKTSKEDTIPKLEMMAIVLAANLANFCLEAMSTYNIRKKIIWSDSRVALAQLSAKSNKTSFIHNRVVKVRELCEDFEIKHVSSKDNPADFVTKPIRAKKLKSNQLWEKGPEWITDKSNWKKEEQIYTLFPDTQEEESHMKINSKHVQVKVTNYLGQINGLLSNNKSSDIWRNEYAKTVRFVAMTKRLIKRAKKLDHEITPIKEMSVNEFAEAERTIVKLMQSESFPEEIELLKKGKSVKKNNLLQMKLYLDEYDIIRCQGRLNDTSFITINTPILFAPDHPLTIMYIQYKHKCYNCCSVNYTLNSIRREIHTIKLRQQIKKVLNNCVICKKLVGRPYRYPENPPLDVYRTRCLEPFSNCGCDYIGPFTVINDLKDAEKETRRTEKYKIWIVLFTCLVTRAIFLTIVPNRSSVAFLNALRELSARYTEPKLMISDNEGAFRKGNRILQNISTAPAMRRNKIIFHQELPGWEQCGRDWSVWLN